MRAPINPVRPDFPALPARTLTTERTINILPSVGHWIAELARRHGVTRSQVTMWLIEHAGIVTMRDEECRLPRVPLRYDLTVRLPITTMRKADEVAEATGQSRVQVLRASIHSAAPNKLVWDLAMLGDALPRNLSRRYNSKLLAQIRHRRAVNAIKSAGSGLGSGRTICVPLDDVLVTELGQAAGSAASKSDYTRSAVMRHAPFLGESELREARERTGVYRLSVRLGPAEFGLLAGQAAALNQTYTVVARAALLRALLRDV